MKPTRGYYMVRLGPKGAYADECRREGWVGADWNLKFDLSGKLPDDWRDFNKAMIPAFLERNPDKSKVAAGLACGALWTLCKGVQKGDLVISPSGEPGRYYVGEVTGGYYFQPHVEISHRRRVDWRDGHVLKDDMSQALRRSLGSLGTLANISKHAEEIESLIRGEVKPAIIANDEVIEDPSVFALEQHLEHFLIQNWAQTELGRRYDIFEEDGEMVGQQYPSDTGPIDILAISKDRKELLVVELKKGRASDVVVGQIQRYMGFVKDDLTNEGQTVRGVIIALEDDLRLRRALSVTTNIDFYRYRVSFKLEPTQL